MTTMISHIFLQNYWWIIVSLLASILVFLMFVQGGQTFIYSIPSNEMQRKMIVNTLGRKWEFTFTTLVTFGGAFFASFPLFYSTSFGGAYWVWMAILFSFIIQAIAYEYRAKPSNVYGQKTFDMFLFINGSLGPLLIGTAVATFFTGSRFSLNSMNQVQWETGWHGLEAVLDIRNPALGFAVLFLVRINGLLFIINTIDNEEIVNTARRKLIMNSLYFLLFFLYFVGSILVAKGFAVDPSTGSVTMEKFKYLHNLIGMPLVLILFLAGVTGVLYGLFISIFKGSTRGIWFTGAATVAAVFALFMIAGFNNTAFYPSALNLQNSLTIRNASSSLFTLKTMMFVSFLIPFVLAYIWYAWRAITMDKITEEEMNSEDHAY
jgi:cytochrome bd ubiquinol oxidase subunit II